MQIYSDTNLQLERLNKDAATDYHHHHHHHNHHYHHYTAKLLYEEVFEKVSILIILNNKDVIPASATCMTPGAEMTPNGAAALEHRSLVRNKTKKTALIVVGVGNLTLFFHEDIRNMRLP
jgi:hypothetical protein